MTVIQLSRVLVMVFYVGIPFNTIQSVKSRMATSLNSEYCPGQRGFKYTGLFNTFMKVQCTVAGSKRGTKSPYSASWPLLKGSRYSVGF